MAFLLPTLLGLLATAMNSQLVYGLSFTYEQIGGVGDGHCLGGRLRTSLDDYSVDKCHTMCSDSPDCYYVSCTMQQNSDGSAHETCIEYDSSSCGVGLLEPGIDDRYTTWKKIVHTTTTTTTTTAVWLRELPGFESVDGGVGRACRGSSASDNSKAYYHLYNNAGPFKACQALCLVTPDCQGIEHHLGGRCEVWIRPGGIGASAPVSGSRCMRRVLNNTLGCDPLGLGCQTGYELSGTTCTQIATFLSNSQYCREGWMKRIMAMTTMQDCILSCKATPNCLYVSAWPYIFDMPDPYICNLFSSESGCDSDSSRVTDLDRPYQLWKLT
ncbi:unnamed protein product [Polarella glacialis]|uniref:Apple domain-containing protein n=1 Tax=Polarella glacialis TaxID=89957 RepID=A0A813GG13_POLGL|nr:unnamed protein product [Polarella glacialis]